MPKTSPDIMPIILNIASYRPSQGALLGKDTSRMTPPDIDLDTLCYIDVSCKPTFPTSGGYLGGSLYCQVEHHVR